MKNTILFLIPILLGISQVSAETGSINVAPVAMDDVAITNEDVPVTINVYKPQHHFIKILLLQFL